MKKVSLIVGFILLLSLTILVSANEITCIDNDESVESYYVTSNVVISDERGGSLTASDSCLLDILSPLEGTPSYQPIIDSMVEFGIINENQLTDSNILIESYCPSNINNLSNPLYNPLLYQSSYSCPNGCSNGACIEETPEPIETTCFDSEGDSDDYFSKGTITAENEGGSATVTDVCLSELEEQDSSGVIIQSLIDGGIIPSAQSGSPNVLIESYCPSSVPESLSDLRPFQKAQTCSFGCELGACLEEEIEEDNVGAGVGNENNNVDTDTNADKNIEDDGDIIINIENSNTQENISFFDKIMDFFKRLFGVN